MEIYNLTYMVYIDGLQITWKDFYNSIYPLKHVINRTYDNCVSVAWSDNQQICNNSLLSFDKSVIDFNRPIETFNLTSMIKRAWKIAKDQKLYNIHYDSESNLYKYDFESREVKKLNTLQILDCDIASHQVSAQTYQYHLFVLSKDRKYLEMRDPITFDRQAQVAISGNPGTKMVVRSGNSKDVLRCLITYTETSTDGLILHQVPSNEVTRTQIWELNDEDPNNIYLQLVVNNTNVLSFKTVSNFHYQGGLLETLFVQGKQGEIQVFNNKADLKTTIAINSSYDLIKMVDYTIFVQKNYSEFNTI